MIIGLSPMAGFTDPAFRVIAHEFGANHAITEMVSAEGIIRAKWDETLLLPDGSPLTSVQLFGSNPKSMREASKLLEKKPFTDININAGCPVRKVVKTGAGSDLLRHPKNLVDIVETLTTQIKKPISVKIRLGFNSPEDSVKIAKLIEKAGASYIIVHARTAVQLYSGKADWKWISKIKKSVSIPVYGNGDIKTWEDAYNMKKQTGCDGVYIGRGAMGNPYLFKEIKENKDIEYTKELAFSWLKEYYNIRKKLNLKTGSFKPIAIASMHSFKGAKDMRRKVALADNDEEILKIL